MDVTVGTGRLAVPVSAMLWVAEIAFSALSVNTSDSFNAPLAGVTGVKVNGTLQIAPAASVAVDCVEVVSDGHAVPPVVVKVKSGAVVGLVPVVDDSTRAGIGKTPLFGTAVKAFPGRRKSFQS